MAEIVLGIGTSHSPMLALLPSDWDLRTDADRAAPSHPYRGKSYTFDELYEVRSTDQFTGQNTPPMNHATNWGMNSGGTPPAILPTIGP